MSHGPKSKKRRAFGKRVAVRLAQAAGFKGINDVLAAHKPQGSRFYHVDDECPGKTPVGKAFWQAMHVVSQIRL